LKNRVQKKRAPNPSKKLLSRKLQLQQSQQLPPLRRLHIQAIIDLDLQDLLIRIKDEMELQVEIGLLIRRVKEETILLVMEEDPPINLAMETDHHIHLVMETDLLILHAMETDLLIPHAMGTDLLINQAAGLLINKEAVLLILRATEADPLTRHAMGTDLLINQAAGLPTLHATEADPLTHHATALDLPINKEEDRFPLKTLPLKKAHAKSLIKKSSRDLMKKLDLKNSAISNLHVRE
jgi:hypothetical protein